MLIVEKNVPPTPFASAFEALYATDLVYRPGCWKLCGDAHCCHFSRLKSRFKLLGKAKLDLPMLPGELAFLRAKGWDRQFTEYSHNATTYDFGTGSVRLEMVSKTHDACACAHDTRTVVCRLYPRLPVFDIEGRLTGTERIGVYDELEHIDDLEPVCRVDALPFEQMDLFLAMCGVLASNPVFLFHLAAYRAAKRHVFDRISSERVRTGRSAFSIFEGAYLRRRLIDHVALKAELRALNSAFDDRYGAPFRTAMAALEPPAEAATPATS